MRMNAANHLPQEEPVNAGSSFYFYRRLRQAQPPVKGGARGGWRYLTFYRLPVNFIAKGGLLAESGARLASALRVK